MAIEPLAAARAGLRVPPEADDRVAEEALIDPRSRVPWNLRCDIERVAFRHSFATSADGPSAQALKTALDTAYGRELFVQGDGGSIPLCIALVGTYLEAEIFSLRVVEPSCRVHAANESVDPSEIENIAMAEALLLASYGEVQRQMQSRKQRVAL